MGGEALAGLSDDIALKVPSHRIQPFQGAVGGSSLSWFELE